MAAVDPGGAKPNFLGRHVVVIEALRRVQEALLGDAPLRDPRQQVFEIAQVRLVGADVLGRKDSVELDAELFVAPRERRLVNVGKDEQLVVTFEVVERVGRIGKGRPIADRGAKGLGLGVIFHLQVSDLVYAHHPSKGVLKLSLLNEQIMLGIHLIRSMRALEIEG